MKNRGTTANPPFGKPSAAFSGKARTHAARSVVEARSSAP